MSIYTTSAAAKQAMNAIDEDIKKLQNAQDKISNASDDYLELSNKFNQAGELVVKAGSIGNRPLDGGKTSETAAKMKYISDGYLGISEEIRVIIKDLHDERREIEKVYYSLRDKEERARNNSSKKTSSTPPGTKSTGSGGKNISNITAMLN